MIRGRVSALLLTLLVLPAACGGGGGGSEVTEIRVPRGAGGVGFLPLLMMEKNKLIEKHAAAAGIEGLQVRWIELGGPTAMNDALLSGAVDFIAELRRRAQVVVLSDTFEQFAEPLVRQLGWPTILCHRLEVEGDRIVGYRLRMPDQKRAAVEAFKSLRYRVLAAGDSYNDTSMLLAADAGFLIHAPDNVIAEFPQLPSVGSHAELLAAMFLEG